MGQKAPYTSTPSESASGWIRRRFCLGKLPNRYCVPPAAPWTPPPAKYAASDLVALRIGFEEKSLQERVKTLGGKWDRQRKVWLVGYGCIAGTPMEKLITA